MKTEYCYEGSCGGYILKEIDEDEEITPCELCDEPATEKVDIDPTNPGRYIADLCAKCAKFEKERMNQLK
jgi:hypothetical protein